MAKYRKASEKTIARGRGKSTDELSLADAKDYFRERAKETGAKRFRHNGQVYDLEGNKVTEAPTRSSGGGTRTSTAEGPKRPKANPNRGKEGPAFENKGRGNAPAPKSPEAPHTSQAARNEPKAGAVIGMAGAGLAAGVAASRANRRVKAAGSNSPTPTRVSVSDKVRAAGAKAKAAAMGVPVTRISVSDKVRAAGAKAAGSNSPTPTRISVSDKVRAAGAKAKAAAMGVPVTNKAPTVAKAGGGRVGGAPAGSALLRGPGGKGVLKMPDIMSLQFMNKGGMVKKK